MLVLIRQYYLSSIFRCTLTKIPESNSLLQKSRLPLGLLIHPFKDLNVSICCFNSLLDNNILGLNHYSVHISMTVSTILCIVIVNTVQFSI